MSGVVEEAANRLLRAVVVAGAVRLRYGDGPPPCRKTINAVAAAIIGGTYTDGGESSWAATHLHARICPGCGRRHRALRIAPPEALCGSCAEELKAAERVFTERRRRALAARRAAQGEE
jgi:hypothetical protein